MTRSIRCGRLALAAALWAGSVRAEPPGRVVTLQERQDGAVEELTDEMRIHLHRTHPSLEYQRIATGMSRQEQQNALAAAGQDSPKILVLAGASLLHQALQRPWPRTQLFFVGVPEHGLPEALSGANLPGVADGCPLDGMLMLVRKMVPGARRLGWLHTADAISGPVAATLASAAASQRFEIARVPASSAGWATGLERVDALLLLAPPLSADALGSIVQGAHTARRPLFTCDQESVARGATAGLIVDPQQTGEAAGRALADLLDGKPAAVGRAEMGRIAIHRKSACESGAVVPLDLLTQALVFEKSFVCSPTARPAPRRASGGFWWVMALGSLGAAVAAAAMLRARGRLRRAPTKLPGYRQASSLEIDQP